MQVTNRTEQTTCCCVCWETSGSQGAGRGHIQGTPKLLSRVMVLLTAAVEFQGAGSWGSTVPENTRKQKELHIMIAGPCLPRSVCLAVREGWLSWGICGWPRSRPDPAPRVSSGKNTAGVSALKCSREWSAASQGLGYCSVHVESRFRGSELQRPLHNAVLQAGEKRDYSQAGEAP